MATVTQCDRCKNIYEPYSSAYRHMTVIVLPRTIDRDIYDLCPDCEKKLRAFIKNEPEE